MQKAAVSKARTDDVKAGAFDTFLNDFLLGSFAIEEKRAWQEAELRQFSKPLLSRCRDTVLHDTCTHRRMFEPTQGSCL